MSLDQRSFPSEAKAPQSTPPVTIQKFCPAQSLELLQPASTQKANEAKARKITIHVPLFSPLKSERHLRSQEDTLCSTIGTSEASPSRKPQASGPENRVSGFHRVSQPFLNGLDMHVGLILSSVRIEGATKTDHLGGKISEESISIKGQEEDASFESACSGVELLLESLSSDSPPADRNRLPAGKGRASIRAELISEASPLNDSSNYEFSFDYLEEEQLAQISRKKSSPRSLESRQHRSASPSLNMDSRPLISSQKRVGFACLSSRSSEPEPSVDFAPHSHVSRHSYEDYEHYRYFRTRNWSSKKLGIPSKCPCMMYQQDRRTPRSASTI